MSEPGSTSKLVAVNQVEIAPASLLPRALPNDRIRLWQNGNLVFNTIPIRSGAAIGISAAIATDNPPETLLSSTTAEEILSIYADFDPLIVRLIKGRIVEITTHSVYDKEPIETWADGHIVLLGDAAQDADALAVDLCGRHRGDLALALAEYQAKRGPVTARIQRLSRKPPAAMMRVAEAEGLTRS